MLESSEVRHCEERRKQVLRLIITPAHADDQKVVDIGNMVDTGRTATAYKQTVTVLESSKPNSTKIVSEAVVTQFRSMERYLEALV